MDEYTDAKALQKVMAPPGGFHFSDWPKTQGFYVMGNMHFGLTTKPSRFHRLMVRLILGWKWRDNV